MEEASHANKVIVKNGIPIVLRSKIMSLSPSRTLMNIEQDLIDNHEASNYVGNGETMAERRRHTLEVTS